MCEEDSEGRDEVSQRDAGVGLPLLVLLGIVKEDEEVVSLALEVDLALLGAAARHDVGVA